MTTLSRTVLGLIERAGHPPPCACPTCAQDWVGVAGAKLIGAGVVLVYYACREGHVWPVLLRHPSFGTERHPDDRPC